MRRDFKKAVVKRLQQEFPYGNPRQAFDAVKDQSDDDTLSLAAIGTLMRDMDPSYTNGEINELMARLDLTNSGAVSFDEFKKLFIADIRKSEAI